MNKKAYGCSDCFAYGTNGCAILTTKLCITRKCSFYKTHEQFVRDLEKYPKVDYKLLYEEKHKSDKKRGEHRCVAHKAHRIKTSK